MELHTATATLSTIAARDNSQAHSNAHYIAKMQQDLNKAREQRRHVLALDGFCEHGILTSSLVPCASCHGAK